MCMGGAPSMPQIVMPPPVPPPPPPPDPLPTPTVPTQADASVRAARQANQQNAAASVGRNATILTSPQGVLDQPASSAKKTLLGQ